MKTTISRWRNGLWVVVNFDFPVLTHPPHAERKRKKGNHAGKNSLFTSACRDSFSAKPLISYQMSSKWADVEHSTKFGKVVSKGHKKSMVWGEL